MIIKYTEEQIRQALRSNLLALAEEQVLGSLRQIASDELDNPTCPRCSGRMWDNRESKRNPNAPDFKCRDRSCDGVIWPKR